jgi:AcrR family transcriptional regulator
MQPQPSAGSSSRERLLQAAKRLFAAQGYEQTATSAIAREAGTSESQLMRYFGGKVGLLQALFDAAWIDLNGRVTRALESADSNRDAILSALQAVATALARDPDLAALFLFEGRRLRSQRPRVHVSKGAIAFAERLKTVVRRAQAAREIRPALNAGAVTSSIIGAAESMIRDRLFSKSVGSRSFAEREFRRTLEAMLDGFAPRNQRPRRPRAK